MTTFAEDLTYARGARERRMLELRRVGTGRPGLSDEFYALVAECIRGERHPVKALAKMQAVDMSTASRWISSARSRGLL